MGVLGCLPTSRCGCWPVRSHAPARLAVHPGTAPVLYVVPVQPVSAHRADDLGPERVHLVAPIPHCQVPQGKRGWRGRDPQVMCCNVAIRQERCKIGHVALPRSKYAFLTLPRYSMIALSNAVEPLRMANIITGQNAYQWSIVSLDGLPMPASNGLQLSPTVALEQLGVVDILFVCGGVNVQEAVSAKILAALRRVAERRIALGALCTGGYALAKAGLLDKYRATIHWENLSALREEFPRIHILGG